MDRSCGVDLVIMAAVDVVVVTEGGFVVFTMVVGCARGFANLIFSLTARPAVPGRIHFGYMFLDLDEVVGVVDGIRDGFSILCRIF